MKMNCCNYVVCVAIGLFFSLGCDEECTQHSDCADGGMCVSGSCISQNTSVGDKTGIPDNSGGGSGSVTPDTDDNGDEPISNQEVSYETLSDPELDNCNVVFTNSWVSNAKELWVSGYTSGTNVKCLHKNEGILQRFNGQNWEPPPFPSVSEYPDLWGVCETSSGDIVALSAETKKILLNGAPVESIQIPTYLIPLSGESGIWCGPNDAIFFVGSDGTLLQYLSGTWVSIISGTESNLHGIVGNDTGTVVIVGAEGTVLELRDGIVTLLLIDMDININSAWISSSGQITVVSGKDGDSEPGRIWVYEDNQWTIVIESDEDVLMGITGNENGTLYAVGATRNDGQATPVVWKQIAGNWTREQLPDADVFLLGVNCMTPSDCYAYGTHNAFYKL